MHPQGYELVSTLTILHSTVDTLKTCLCPIIQLMHFPEMHSSYKIVAARGCRFFTNIRVFPCISCLICLMCVMCVDFGLTNCPSKNRGWS